MSLQNCQLIPARRLSPTIEDGGVALVVQWFGLAPLVALVVISSIRISIFMCVLMVAGGRNNNYGRIRLPDIWHTCTWTGNHESETNRDTIWLKRESSSYGFFCLVSCVACSVRWWSNCLKQSLFRVCHTQKCGYVANLMLNSHCRPSLMDTRPSCRCNCC